MDFAFPPPRPYRDPGRTLADPGLRWPRPCIGWHLAPHVLDLVDGCAYVTKDQAGRPGSPSLDVTVALGVAARVLRGDLTVHRRQQHARLAVSVARPVSQHMTPGPPRQQRRSAAVIAGHPARRCLHPPVGHDGRPQQAAEILSRNLHTGIVAPCGSVLTSARHQVQLRVVVGPFWGAASPYAALQQLHEPGGAARHVVVAQSGVEALSYGTLPGARDFHIAASSATRSLLCVSSSQYRNRATTSSVRVGYPSSSSRAAIGPASPTSAGRMAVVMAGSFSLRRTRLAGAAVHKVAGRRRFSPADRGVGGELGAAA